MFFRRPLPAPESAPVPTIEVVELMLAFESLGDNCEFGLLQRRCGADPQGLLRLAFCRSSTLEAILACELEGVMDARDLELAPHPLYPDKLLARSRQLADLDHTVPRMREGGDDRDAQLRRIAYLKRRLLGDLRDGSKIFVRRGRDSSPETIAPILRQFRRLSRAWFLLVVETEDEDRHGSVDQIGERCLVGYLGRLAITGDVLDSEVETWLAVLLAAYGRVHGTSIASGAPTLRPNAALPPPRIERFQDVSVRRLLLPSGADDCLVLEFARDMAFDETIYSIVLDDLPAGLRSFVCAVRVFVPASYAGNYVRVLTTTAVRQMDRQADLRKRDVWQRVWVHGHLRLGTTTLVVELRTDAPRGSILMLAGCSVEAGTYPNPPADRRDLPEQVPD